MEGVWRLLWYRDEKWTIQLKSGEIWNHDYRNVIFHFS